MHTRLPMCPNTKSQDDACDALSSKAFGPHLDDVAEAR